MIIGSRSFIRKTAIAIITINAIIPITIIPIVPAKPIIVYTLYLFILYYKAVSNETQLNFLVYKVSRYQYYL
jgi:hypothetical protein